MRAYWLLAGKIALALTLPCAGAGLLLFYPTRSLLRVWDRYDRKRATRRRIAAILSSSRN